MTFDYVPELPRLERERHPVFPDLFGEWVVSFEGRQTWFHSWAVALEFIEDGGHLLRRTA